MSDMRGPRITLSSDVPNPKKINENCPSDNLFSQSHNSGSFSGNSGHGNVYGGGGTVAVCYAVPGTANSGVGYLSGEYGAGDAGIIEFSGRFLAN